MALLASSTFGFPRSERSERIVEAVHILDNREVDFEYDGEMAVDVALDREKMALYPFCRLTDTANVLIMPAIHSASISTKLLQQVGGVTRDGAVAGGAGKIRADRPAGRQDERDLQRRGDCGALTSRGRETRSTLQNKFRDTIMSERGLPARIVKQSPPSTSSLLRIRALHERAGWKPRSDMNSSSKPSLARRAILETPSSPMPR